VSGTDQFRAKLSALDPLSCVWPRTVITVTKRVSARRGYYWAPDGGRAVSLRASKASATCVPSRFGGMGHSWVFLMLGIATLLATGGLVPAVSYLGTRKSEATGARAQFHLDSHRP
jgi:hypothetical protein